jgi:hypothetical protein
MAHFHKFDPGKLSNVLRASGRPYTGASSRLSELGVAGYTCELLCEKLASDCVLGTLNRLFRTRMRAAMAMSG